MTWTTAERARLKLLTIDAQKTPPEKLIELVRHFQGRGTLFGATEKAVEPVSKGLGRKIRDLTQQGALDWVLDRAGGEVGGVTSDSTNAGRAPAQDRGVVHRELVRRGGDRLRGALAGLPPVPSDLIHGGAGDWWDAEAAIAQIAGDGQLQTLRRHAAGSDFPQAIQQFFDRLMPYPAAAQNALKSVEVAIRSRIPHSVSTAAAGLFCQAVDRACVASAEHRGSWDKAEGEFRHLTMMGPHVMEAGGVYQVTTGPFVAARLSTRVEAEKVADAVEVVAGELVGNTEIRALAEAYFELLGLRRELVEHLSPVAVDKWAVDGRCVWCPAPG